MKTLTREMQLRSKDDKTRTATFVVSTEAVVMTPYGPEVLRMSGARLDRYLTNPIVLDTHKRESIDDLIGKATVTIDEKRRELLAEIEYAPTPRGDRAWDLVKGGFLRACSIGYGVVEETIVRLRAGEFDGVGDARVEGPALIANDWVLSEISNTPIPADANALRRTFYAGLVGDEPEEPETVKNKKPGTVKNKKPGDIYQRAMDEAKDEGVDEERAESKAKTCDKCGQELPEERAEGDDKGEDEKPKDKPAESDGDDEGDAERAKDEELDEGARSLVNLRASVLAIAPDSLRTFAEGLLLTEGVTLEGARRALLTEQAKRSAPAGTPSPADPTPAGSPAGAPEILSADDFLATRS